MNLDKFYSLRKDFIIIGLTGRTGSGCSELANELKKKELFHSMNYIPKSPLLKAEEIKFNICYNYLKQPKNYSEFTIITYKDVLLLHLLFEAKTTADPIDYIIQVVCQNGDGLDNYINRFGKKEDVSKMIHLKNFLEEDLDNQLNNLFSDSDMKFGLVHFLKQQKAKNFIKYFFSEFQEYSQSFFKLLNEFSVTKRTRFLHDISINLRKEGRCLQYTQKPENNLNHIYLVAETINRLIKLYRENNNGKARIVIDSLKNSLELMYFKEKYSGFYMVAINKDEEERKRYIKEVLEKTANFQAEDVKEIINLDNAEYKGDDVKSGKFTVPDIENCIQKSDYHIFHSREDSLINHQETSLHYQLVKLLALIYQPGIITPTPLERTMQVAFNAKYNSGCISRQVGAVITDKNFSIKSIGWNDVAQNQMSCKLRNVQDLINNKNPAVFSDYEKNGGNFKVENTSKTFKELLEEDFVEGDMDDLKGRNCSFCFKSFQNNYEGEKNQVHTRSLHAEENAMMQISKYGGIGLQDGLLFTTASPCELCSKKAFQLGVKVIYYIDPYPGIAKNHTLKNGINGEGEPEMIMFRGAVGRLYHKLYEPFMSEKDEIKILTGFQPIERIKRKKIEDLKADIDKWDLDIIIKEKIRKALNS